MKNTFSIQDDFVNSRLDRWFRRQVSDVPQSLIEKNLRKGNIKVNNKKEKSSYKLRFNDLVIIKNINFTKNNIIPRVSIFGLTYKPDTDDIRESPACKILKNLYPKMELALLILQKKLIYRFVVHQNIVNL